MPSGVSLRIDQVKRLLRGIGDALSSTYSQTSNGLSASSNDSKRTPRTWNWISAHATRRVAYESWKQSWMSAWLRPKSTEWPWSEPMVQTQPQSSKLVGLNWSVTRRMLKIRKHFHSLIDKLLNLFLFYVGWFVRKTLSEKVPLKCDRSCSQALARCCFEFVIWKVGSSSHRWFSPCEIQEVAIFYGFNVSLFLQTGGRQQGVFREADFGQRTKVWFQFYIPAWHFG